MNVLTPPRDSNGAGGYWPLIDKPNARLLLDGCEVSRLASWVAAMSGDSYVWLKVVGGVNFIGADWASPKEIA